MEIDIQGHRGCRGLMPENTIAGFIKALDLGVHTLEMDAVVSKDHKIIISHEPFMSHEIATQPNGRPILKENEMNHNVYQLTSEELKKYDTGTKFFEKFPDQQKLATYKPTLEEVVSAVNEKLKELGRASINYNIEIKRRTEWDYVHHPPYQEFADLMIQTVKDLGIEPVSTIQCFDIETLKYINRRYPEIRLVFLVANAHTPAINISELGFVPTVYSPYYKLVDSLLVSYCDKLGMQLIPWTVNEQEDIVRMIDFGVTGIISDYPDRVISEINRRQ